MTLKAVLALSLALVVGAANAAELILNDKSQGLKITLTDKACTQPKMINILGKEGASFFKAAKVVFQGINLEACYTVDKDFVYIVDETGDGGAVPGHLFIKPNEKRI